MAVESYPMELNRDLNQIVEDANRSTARILKLVKDKTGIDYRMEA